MVTTIPATAVLILRCSSDDYPVVQDVATRARIAAERPDLADDMRVATLRVFAEAKQAYIKISEHTDPMTPATTVTRLCAVPLTALSSEIARMRDDGAIPGYIATAALRELASRA